MKPKVNAQDFPKFRLSTDQDLILFLIKNELLGIRFMNQLSTVGFDSSLFNIELGTAILSLMGFSNRTDTLWEWYHSALDNHALKIDVENQATIRAITFDFYVLLRIKLHSEQEHAMQR